MQLIEGLWERFVVSALLALVLDALVHPKHPGIVMAFLGSFSMPYVLDLLNRIDKGFEKHIIVYDDRPPSPPAK